jgi:uncharacterized membrane protein
MKLSTHNQLAMLYRNFYNEMSLPNNLCAYFWKIVICLICIPFIWPALLFNKIFDPFKWKNYYGNGEFYKRNNYIAIHNVIGLLFQFIIFSFGIVFTKLYWNFTNLSLFSLIDIYSNGIIMIILCLSIIIPIVLLIKKIPIHIETEEELELKYKAKSAKNQLKELKYRQSFRYLLIQRFKAWKNNNCPIIEWEDTKTQ